MDGHGTQQLLEVWERGWNQRPARRAVGLLAWAHPGQPAELLAQLPVGERNRHLLKLRQALFGPHLTLTGRCPKCGEAMEWPIRVDDLILPVGAAAAPLEHLGYRVTYRVPTTSDLLGLPDRPEEATRALLSRCVIRAERGAEQVPTSSLPPEVLDAVEDAMAQADPQATLEFDLTCPACGHQGEQGLDIAQVLWREVEHWAKRTLLEVHRLARAYGWSEADILGLSAARRQLYLQLLPD